MRAFQRVHRCDPRTTGSPECPLCDKGADDHNRWRTIAARVARVSRSRNLGTPGLSRAEVNTLAAEHAVLAVFGDAELAPFKCEACDGSIGAWRVGGLCWACAIRGTSVRLSGWYMARSRAVRIYRTARGVLNHGAAAMSDVLTNTRNRLKEPAK